jgi:hypothetical protein
MKRSVIFFPQKEIADIGIIGAMEIEIEGIRALMTEKEEKIITIINRRLSPRRIT